MARDLKRGALTGVLVLGLALAAAPLAFGMFTRAPLGGEMMKDFAPFMSAERLDRFRANLSTVSAVQKEVGTFLTGDAARHAAFPALADFAERWPAIDSDMNEMMGSIQGSIDAYHGLTALPPFALFPWFFVIPGLLLAAFAGLGLRATKLGRSAGGFRTALIAIAVGLIAAPFAFQMFTRAPAGARMLNDFKPMMSRERVTAIQGYFLVAGYAEGELRNQVLPTAGPEEFPAARELGREWPHIASGMAPMIGAMADNLDNFQAIDALPPFSLFPWFFVAPGVLVLALVFAGRRSGAPAHLTKPATEGI